MSERDFYDAYSEDFWRRRRPFCGRKEKRRRKIAIIDRVPSSMSMFMSHSLGIPVSRRGGSKKFSSISSKVSKSSWFFCPLHRRRRHAEKRLSRVLFRGFSGVRRRWLPCWRAERREEDEHDDDDDDDDDLFQFQFQFEAQQRLQAVDVDIKATKTKTLLRPIVVDFLCVRRRFCDL